MAQQAVEDHLEHEVVKELDLQDKEHRIRLDNREETQTHARLIEVCREDQIRVTIEGQHLRERKKLD